jgi:hypothetical protein
MDELKDENLKEVDKEVRVNSDDLKKLIAKVEAQDKEIKKLTEVADKGRLAHWNSQHREDAPKVYRVSVFGGKIVVSWKMRDNAVWKDAEGKWKENQNIELTYSDGEKQLVPYIDFGTKTEKAEVKFMSSTQQGGKTYLQVETADGQKLMLDSVFIN